MQDNEEIKAEEALKDNELDDVVGGVLKDLDSSGWHHNDGLSPLYSHDEWNR